MDNCDQALVTEVSYLVLDFETVTHKGYAPEPVELGALCITGAGVIDAELMIDWLIQPPAHLPLNRAEAGRLGVRPEDMRDKPSVAEALALLDNRCKSRVNMLVAQNASYDVSFIRRYATACPYLVQLPVLDTVRLARHLLPPLRSYRLDSLADHFDLPIPLDRHRALPDVRLTCDIFARLLDLWRQRYQDQRVYLLRRVAGLGHERTPVQPSLFGG